MEDIYDIYEPIYKNTNNIPLIILLTIISLLIIALVFYFLKNKKKTKVITLDSVYKKSLSSILFLKGEHSKLHSKDFLIKSNKILFNFLEFVYKKNYFSLTSVELRNKFTEYDFPNKEYLLDLFTNVIDQTLYGKNNINNDERIVILKNYGEIIDSIYREQKVD